MSVETALEELYSVDPAEFTKTRDRLVKDLKKVGDKDGAALIAAKRKPTQIAYVLNQLSRREPDAVAELVDVGRELAREQRRALRGEAGHGLRESIERQRKAVAEVANKAASVMKDLGLDATAHLPEIATALQAALVDPIIGSQLEEGRLEKAPEAAIGFGGPITPESAPAPKSERPEKHEKHEKEKSEPPPPPKRDERAIERARKHAEHAASEANKARHAATHAQREAKTANAKSAKLTEQATAAEREAKEAIALATRLAEQAAHAQREAAAATKKAESLEEEAESAAAAARDAEAALEALTS